MILRCHITPGDMSFRQEVVTMMMMMIVVCKIIACCFVLRQLTKTFIVLKKSPFFQTAKFVNRKNLYVFKCKSFRITTRLFWFLDEYTSHEMFVTDRD